MVLVADRNYGKINFEFLLSLRFPRGPDKEPAPGFPDCRTTM